MSDSGYPADPVLVVDDEPAILSAVEIALELGGITNVVTCSESTSAASLVSTTRFSAVTLDLVMPGIGGVELLGIVQEQLPDTPVVVVTSTSDVETAVELMRKGVFDYIVKPVDSNRLVTTLRRAIENFEMQRENAALRRHLLNPTLERPDAFEHITTHDEVMYSIFGYIEAIAPTSLPVLITGETGTGKELIATAIHRASGRTGELVTVNTAGLDDQLFSDTLFGHVKGAYTGSTTDRKGVIGKAVKGTLFLDEIGDLSPESQIKLLRLIQQREYYPLGSDNVVRTDARFVFATNRDLPERVETGEFRHDLWYRLRSHMVRIPPLRERRGDIPLLVNLFLRHAVSETGKPLPDVSRGFISTLMRYDYPGNVRELEGMILDAVVRDRTGTLTAGAISDGAVSGSPVMIPSGAGGQHGADDLFSDLGTLPTLKSAVDDLIEEALRRADGNQTTAAALLGMTRSALNKRLNRRDGNR